MFAVNTMNYLSLLENYAQHPCSFLCLNKDVEYFEDPNIEGIIAYRLAGRRCIAVIAGIITSQENKKTFWAAFEEFAKSKRRKVIVAHFLQDDIKFLDAKKYRINQIGASYAVGLDEYEISGKKFSTLRNKIARAKRKGVIVQEVTNKQELNKNLRDQIAEVDREWLNKKGKPELDFMIGQLNLTAASCEKRLFLAIKDSQLLGYLQYSKTYGDLSGWMHDLSRRRQRIPIGTMEYLNLIALQQFKERGEKFLHFGFTPFTGLDDQFEFTASANKFITKLMHFLYKHGKFLYPAKSQLQYKKSWQPTVIIPEYIAFEGGYDLRSLFSFLKMINAI